ncbi:MAG: glycosyltransferase family 2 protein [Balneolales bacterium]
MRYGIVIPAFNEQDYLEEMIESIANQDLMPEILVLVNDASDDNTGEIAEECARKYAWIKVIHREGKSGYAIGSKIIETFMVGLNTVDWKKWDVISKLDADQIMPPNYFSSVIRLFEEHADVGICGGVYTLRKNGKLTEERHTDHFHVRGGLKSWRKTCFESIGGIRTEYGFDTLDELLASYHGWRTVVIPELKVELRRPTGTLIGTYKMHAKAGNMFYRIGYDPFIGLISSIKRIFIKPYFLSTIYAYAAYLMACLKGESRMVTPDQARFIRQLRYKRMINKLMGKVRS